MNEIDIYKQLVAHAIMAANMVYFFAGGELTQRDRMEIEYHNDNVRRYSLWVRVLSV